MRSAVLFDLDDTLNDRKASIKAYTSYLVRDFSDQLLDTDLEQLAQLIIKTDRGGYLPRKKVSEALTRVLPWANPPSSSQLLDNWFDCFPLATQSRSHVLTVLQTLKKQGLTLGMVTNGSTTGQNRKIDQLGIRAYFSSIIVSETVGFKKPHPTIFQLALSELRKRPDETWFIGDNPQNDIIGAAAVGLTPIWLSGCHPWPDSEPPPARQITTLAELPDMLL